MPERAWGFKSPLSHNPNEEPLPAVVPGRGSFDDKSAQCLEAFAAFTNPQPYRLFGNEPLLEQELEVTWCAV